MARSSVIARDARRAKKVLRCFAQRTALKKMVYDKSLSIVERLQYVDKLDVLARDSSITRKKNRCFVTGRPRGFYRRFGVSRIVLRNMVAFSLMPGVRKSSW